MILAPTSGPIGIQPHGTRARMVNKDTATLAVNDVVITSFKHSDVVFPGANSVAVTAANARLSPLACVRKTDNADVAASGNGDHSHSGYIGVVVDLGSGTGLTGQEVTVQFGGLVQAKVRALTNPITLGSTLTLADTANTGCLTNIGGSTNDVGVGMALEGVTVATGTVTMWVLIKSDLHINIAA